MPQDHLKKDIQSLMKRIKAQVLYWFINEPDTWLTLDTLEIHGYDPEHKLFEVYYPNQFTTHKEWKHFTDWEKLMIYNGIYED